VTLPQRRNPLAFPRAAEPVYPAFHPLNKDTYDHGFDLIGEIAEHKYDYQAVQGDPWLAIHNFPNYLRTSIDRVRSRAHKSSEPKPSISVVVACCIQRGVHDLSEYNDIKGLIAAKEKLDNQDNVSSLAEEFYSWWHAFKIGAPDSVRTGSVRQNIALPTHIKGTLHDLSDAIGMSDSSLAVLATMRIMSECSVSVRPEKMSEAVDEFLDRVSVRKSVADWWFSREPKNDPSKGNE
jgi:hypothetical protein